MLLMSAFRLVWFFQYRRGDEISYRPGDEINSFLGDFFRSLWLGIRFDLSAFCHLSIIPFLIWLLWLIVGPTRWGRTIIEGQRWLWLCLLSVFTFILAADFTYYGYFQDHFNAMVFGLFEDDTRSILKTIWKNYPVIKIFGFLSLAVWALNFWLRRLWSHLPPARSKYGWGEKVLVIVVFLALGLGARGTLGLFPLEIMHTTISANAFLNTLSFNGAHALVHAIQLYDQQRQAWNENLKQLGYLDQPGQAIFDFNGRKVTAKFHLDQLPLTQLTSKKAPAISPHVVVVLMESWGSDWMTEQTSTFDVMGAFARHRHEDFFTPFLMPSSVATIGSLGSLSVDLPHRFYSPFLTESFYLGVEFSTAPARIFQSLGYQTHFIYGGSLGWRSIDKFLPKQGFQTLHGENDIKAKLGALNEDDVNHDWGIYDEFVFNYAHDLLKNAQQPQFLFILTTSNHPPYTIPKNFIPPPLQITPTLESKLIGDIALDRERIKAYQYANHQLGLFLDKLKHGPMAAKTVLAATGDHSFYIRAYNNLEFFEKWSVPFYLYLPEPLRTDVPKDLPMGNHIDVFPTLYNLLFSELAYDSLGNDLLNPHYSPWAFHGPSWTSFDREHGVIISPNGAIVSSLCFNPGGRLESCPISPAHEVLRKRLVSMMGTADFIFEREHQKTTQAPHGK
jgi:phosphoglycerol transferase MdoB-like AlkP superfamily enzyme